MKLKTLAIVAAAAVAVPVAASAEAPARGKDARINRMFDRFDANKDGKITRAELKQYRESQFKAADTDNNGNLNSIEMAAHMKAQRAERVNERFTALDKNKDGKITLDEMRSGRADRGRGTRRGDRRDERRGMRSDERRPVHYRMHRRRHGSFIFWRLDRDGDGAVTKEEFMRAAERRGKRRVAFRFARLDDNRNGLISRDEFVEAPTRLFRRFDANDDGAVTREEVQQAMANFRQHREGRGWRRDRHQRHHGRGHWGHRGHRDGWGGGRRRDF